MSEFSTIDAMAACDRKEARKPFEPLPRGSGPQQLKGLASRTRMATVGMTDAGHAAVMVVAKKHDVAVSAVVGVVLDEIAHAGDMEALFVAALKRGGRS